MSPFTHSIRFRWAGFVGTIPELCRGQISCSFDTDDMAGWKKVILAHYGMNWMSRPHFISHHWKQLPGDHARAAQPALLRMPLLTWTVRSAKEQASAHALRGQCFLREHTFLPAGSSPKISSTLRALLIEQIKEFLL